MASLCILCEGSPPIENSHMVPKFFIRRLMKGTSVKALRNSNYVTRPVQDGWKGRYLCQQCEMRFSAWETDFANRIYDPYLNGNKDPAVQDIALVLFVTSLHFRYLEYAKDRNKGLPDSVDVPNLIEKLRDALLNGRSPGDIHLYATPLRQVIDHEILPAGVNTYFFEVIDGCAFNWHLPSEKAFWISYVKVPGFMFFSSTEPLEAICTKPAQIEPYKIDGNGTFDIGISHSRFLLAMVNDVVKKRSQEIQSAYRCIPESQMEKIIEQIRKDPDYKKRRAYQSYILDLQLIRKQEI